MKGAATSAVNYYRALLALVTGRSHKPTVWQVRHNTGAACSGVCMCVCGWWGGWGVRVSFYVFM